MLFCLKVALLLLIKSISANSCIVLLTEAFIMGHLQELSVVKRITFMWSTCTIAFGSVCACPPVSHSVTRTVGALRSGSFCFASVYKRFLFPVNIFRCRWSLCSILQLWSQMDSLNFLLISSLVSASTCEWNWSCLYFYSYRTKKKPMSNKG